MQFHNVMVCLVVTALTTARAFAVDVVVDNDQGAPEYVESGAWRLSASPGYNGGTYHFASEVPQDVLSTATWTPLIPTTGPYDVFALFRSSTNRSTDVQLTLTHAGG